MASTNKTANGLNQWILSDMPKMEDFNADNAILDAAVTKAQNPLAQIADGSIPAAKLADGIQGFASVIARATGPVDLTPLKPYVPGAPLYVYAGTNIELNNWSEGDDRQQLYIGVTNMLSYYGDLSGINTNPREGIFTVQSSAVGTKPESDFSTALLIVYKPNNGNKFCQIWIGKGFYRRQMNSSGTWSTWELISAGLQKCQSGGTRPSSPAGGECFFDESLGKPIWWSSAASKWVDSTGTAV